MKYILHTDGGARGNPGPAAIGIVLEDGKGREIKKLGLYIGRTTNNEAEYRALITGLEAIIDDAKEPAGADVECILDSELIVKQLSGEYRVKSPTLRPFFNKAGMLAQKFGSVTFKHVKRAENKNADKLVNQVLDAREQ